MPAEGNSGYDAVPAAPSQEIEGANVIRLRLREALHVYEKESVGHFASCCGV